MMMGISPSTARWLAPASFLFNFAAQQYGMFSTPNMKTIHDRNLSFFSPQPFFIAGFFFPQQILQLAWLYRLWTLRPAANSAAAADELDQLVDYAPIYALGNICIGTWMFFWNAERLAVANVFVVINTTAQLLFVAARLRRLRPASTSSLLTHGVAKTFAGIGVLDLLHNSSVAFFPDAPAGALVKALTAVAFAAGAAASDWILGACLVYDLVAMAVGQGTLPARSPVNSDGWAALLGVYAVGAAAIVAVKNVARPPYEGGTAQYEPAASEEV